MEDPNNDNDYLDRISKFLNSLHNVHPAVLVAILAACVLLLLQSPSLKKKLETGLVPSPQPSLSPIPIPSTPDPDKFTLRINVRDDATQEPISDVKVEFNYFGSPSVLYTDSSGYVNFENIKATTSVAVSVYLSKDGYISKNYTLDLDTSLPENKNLPFFMTKEEVVEPTPAPLGRPIPDSWIPQAFSIDVKDTKVNGSKWDATQVAPDISVCISSDQGDKDCLLNNETLDLDPSTQCNNSYECNFYALAPSGKISIEIIDMDLSAHDQIGSGFCQLGEICQIGQATVTISDVPN